MAVFAETATYLVYMASSFMLLAFLARLFIQMTSVLLYAPLAQAVVKITDPCLQFAEKFLPKTAPNSLLLGLIFAVEVLKLTLIYVLNAGAVPSVFVLLGMALSEVMSLLVNVAFYAIIADAIVSWIPAAQAGRLQHTLSIVTTPLLAPIRQVLARYDLGIDLSPLIALVGIHMVQLLVLEPFSNMVFHFLI